MALAAQGRVSEARQVATELAKLAGEVPADAPAGLNKARDVLAIAAAVVQSRIAGAEGRSADAIALLRDAVAREDRLAYDEPADWFFPVRHLLGAQLLQAGQAAAAEAVFREDLQRNPDNGWALFGLAESLRRQHRAEAASQAENRFRTAWAHADITLASSAF
jgi:tetratricopeptide (TPR) repeat protein